MMDLHGRIQKAHQELAARLLAEMTPGGFWTGRLSSSALSTATAVVALSEVDAGAHANLVSSGLQWLAQNVNADGGWGDTTRSRSNLSTTALVWAAFGAAKADAAFQRAVSGAAAYLTKEAGSLANLVPAIEASYGNDRTFSVPITMTLALSGRLGPNGWNQVRPLPFELAAFPRSLFSALRLPVVSYALPALIAIGQVIHHHQRPWNPLRQMARARTLDLLTRIQPSNGGFLEATPLTSFVTMSLAGMGQADHKVARRGAEFLRKAVRADGSWPIDTNLSTWVTTLSLKALRHTPTALDASQRAAARAWLLAQQYEQEHLYTGAAPGGWAWTDLPGGVPDADDTSGALLALHALQETTVPKDPALLRSVASGVDWLLRIQNRDGGIPTFCRGWGTLPFDRSTPEITAHALRAWRAWKSLLPESQAARVRSATRRAIEYLVRSQGPEGAWRPLWFGNEHAPGHENPAYGTALVLLALKEIAASGSRLEGVREGAAREWLSTLQDPSGGWGGDKGVVPSVEETALVLSALHGATECEQSVRRGVEWLLEALRDSARSAPAPIGLYFARLWYFERLYPVVFSLDALGRFLRENGPPGGSV